MSRTQRLFDLLQILRRHRYPVSGATLASELGVSLRTLYRDIATLQQQGAEIEGEPGLGYVLRPGFMLPPLMLSEEEIEALTLGARWVARQGDRQLGAAADNLLAKVAAILPDDLRDKVEGNSLLVGPGPEMAVGPVDLSLIREAIRKERKVNLTYRDQEGRDSTRIIWPFALGFFQKVRVLLAWCELRQGLRHFRADRIADFEIQDVRYPRRRQALLKDWQEENGIKIRNAFNADKN
ncbi:helix-turn-helix transcriptional regulator [Aestuariispira ectoiniformans]|uniref:helix-turn-helix transcriptional regulator n=1 Tax=Aestuariispira ectoiniformans TaxID=2775080 RepID=UPI00223B506B|nr:YafY family protein [Aestuariispira ectoiniformans]